MNAEIEQKLRDFIVETFLFGEDDPNLLNDSSFIELGVIDSTGVLEVVEFVEDSFGLSVADDELVPENFDSIGQLSEFICSKKGSPA
ncbi:MAG: acyl carrier protein [Planctomycetota bacterium]|nr:MAG: acyl carrier protein [Planctomycetota bacterium]